MHRRSILKRRRGLSRISYIAVVLFVVVAAAFLFYGNKESCGNGVCGPGENCFVCAKDCGCADGERCSVKDRACARPTCGDGVCDAGECGVCAEDCGVLDCCGNGRCDVTIQENCVNCPSDCGGCSSQGTCGNRICEQGEDCANCPSDCGKCAPSTVCGDGVCGNGENCWDCPRDCKCGEGEYCSPEEKRCISPVCGNGRCEIFESSANCCIDCPCELDGTTCNNQTKLCETPPFKLGDDAVKQSVMDYFEKKSMKVENITLKQVRVWVKTGRVAEVKLQGESALKFVLVTEDKEVMELPFF